MNKLKRPYILVGILLVALVGVSFALYITWTRLNQNPANVYLKTVKAGDTTLTVEGLISFNDAEILPGHQNISAIKVTAQGNNENILFNLTWTGNSSLPALNYTVYKSTIEANPSITCNRNKRVLNGSQILYEECVSIGLDEMQKLNQGVISVTSESTKITLAEDSIISSNRPTVSYYYIVLEYPNTDSKQNADMNSVFEGEIGIELVESQNMAKDYILADKKFSVRQNVGEEYFGDNTTGTVFTAEDDYGTTYYYAGMMDDNWFKFGKYRDDEPDVYLGYFSEEKKVDAAILYNSLEECQNATSYNHGCDLDRKAGKDIYWRIVRINGDGSIRLIYNGTTTDQTEDTSQIAQTTFNEKRDNNAYVGYMYGDVEMSTYSEVVDKKNSTLFYTYFRNKYVGTNYTFDEATGEYKLAGTMTIFKRGESNNVYSCLSTDQEATCNEMYKIIDSTPSNIVVLAYSNIPYDVVHANKYDSTIKTKVDSWYERSLYNSIYEPYIDINTGFCGDRKPVEGIRDYSTIGTGALKTMYRSYSTESVYNVTYKCAQENDLYTTKNASHGNKALKYPVALITGDEVFFAGGSELQNGGQNYYLNKNITYWTMSPGAFNVSALMQWVRNDGYMGPNTANDDTYVRPVINLKADVELSGNGTKENPYQIVGVE